MILLLDNYDSFTFNLFQLVGSRAGPLGPVRVVRNDAMTAAELGSMAPSHVVVSPGPGHPRDSGLSLLASDILPTTPILGVCLGHQALALCHGARIRPALTPTHGHAVPIQHDGSPPFARLRNPFLAALYHSLAVDGDALPECLVVTARAADGTVMALRHRARPHVGVQFHPESFMTPAGTALIDHFLAWT